MLLSYPAFKWTGVKLQTVENPRLYWIPHEGQIMLWITRLSLLGDSPWTDRCVCVRICMRRWERPTQSKGESVCLLFQVVCVGLLWDSFLLCVWTKPPFPCHVMHVFSCAIPFMECECLCCTVHSRVRFVCGCAGGGDGSRKKKC